MCVFMFVYIYPSFLTITSSQFMLVHFTVDSSSSPFRLILAGCGLADDDHEQLQEAQTDSQADNQKSRRKSFGKNAVAKIVNSDPAIFSRYVDQFIFVAKYCY